MADTFGHVGSLALAKATGMWTVETEDNTYLVDADARALTLLHGNPSHPLHGSGWLGLTVVYQASTERAGLLQVGALHMLGVVPPDGSHADTLFVQARVTSIEQATLEDVAAAPERLGPRGPKGSSALGELVLDDASGVWAVHGRPGSPCVYIDADAHTVLRRHLLVPEKAERWLPLKKVRNASEPRDVVRVGEPVTFKAAGFPDGHLTLDNVTHLRTVATVELSSLSDRLTPLAATGSGDSPRVVLPRGEHVKLKVTGEPPGVLDDKLVEWLLDLGLGLPPERRQPKPARIRLVVDSRAKFLVDGRNIGAKKGLRAVGDAVSWTIRQAVDAIRTSKDETDTGAPDRDELPHDEPAPSVEAENAQVSRVAAEQVRPDPGPPAERYVDVDTTANRQVDELLEQVGAGVRVVLTRDDAPAAVLLGWSTWCQLNADRAREEYAYWSAWDQDVFDHDQYADLIADWPHRFKNAPLPPVQRRWQR